MTEPKKFSLLNIDIGSRGYSYMPQVDSTLIELIFSLSHSINVEKRTILSLPEVFADLGGLYEFLATGIVYLIGRF